MWHSRILIYTSVNPSIGYKYRGFRSKRGLLFLTRRNILLLCYVQDTTMVTHEFPIYVLYVESWLDIRIWKWTVWNSLVIHFTEDHANLIPLMVRIKEVQDETTTYFFIKQEFLLPSPSSGTTYLRSHRPSDETRPHLFPTTPRGRVVVNFQVI